MRNVTKPFLIEINFIFESSLRRFDIEGQGQSQPGFEGGEEEANQRSEDERPDSPAKPHRCGFAVESGEAGTRL